MTCCRRIGEYLGERSDFTAQVLTAYSHAFDFHGLSFVEAVRLPCPYPDPYPDPYPLPLPPTPTPYP